MVGLSSCSQGNQQWEISRPNQGIQASKVVDRERTMQSAAHAKQTLVGVDGCRAGWVAVSESGKASISTQVFGTISELLLGTDPDALVAIDIPMGLTSSGHRLCDVSARQLLRGPRASSVFPAPTRPALRATTYRIACEVQQGIDGKKVSKQAFAIYPKIREVDDVLRTTPSVRSRIREVHPEVSFAYWNDRQPLAASKRSAAGAAEREQLIDAVWPGIRGELWQRLPKGAVKRDDLNDAFAALWTARRIVGGTAVTLPEQPVRDSEDLVMEIVA
jgi:predicted RNase H-like nuclease